MWQSSGICSFNCESVQEAPHDLSKTAIILTFSDGKLMELPPRPVDVPVVRPIGESYSGHDVQLETAVRELLKQIGNNHQ